MKAKSSIGVKLYIFIIVTVLAVAIGTAILARSEEHTSELQSRI